MEEYDKSGAYGERGSKPQNDMEQSEKRRNTKAKAIWAALICIFGLALIIGGAAVRSGPLWGAGSLALAAVLCITTIFTRSTDTLMLALILLVPAIILLFIIAREKMKKRLHLRSFLPYWGIIAEAACVPLALLSIETSYLTTSLGFFILLVAFFCPVFGMVAGIVAITQKRKECSTGGFVTAIIDIALPPLAVIIPILLISQGVIVITFM